ncbi:MAG TPA: hypothetical protein VNE17_10385 [Nitrolancea sp.]|nr:hypothetical protein [Nitrolancea sp.]
MKRRKVVTIAFGVIGLIAIIALLLTQFVLKQDSIIRPTAPPSVAAIRSDWQSIILLPTFLPECLTYDPTATSIRSDPGARGGKALDVQLIAANTAACGGAVGSRVTITQAPALESLSGPVLTVSEGRMQFARLIQTSATGQTEVTLQWHCLVDVMCRIKATTGSLVTEAVLSRVADSFEIIKSAP